MDVHMKLHTCSAEASVNEQNCTMSWSAFGGESESIVVICVIDLSLCLLFVRLIVYVFDSSLSASVCIHRVTSQPCGANAKTLYKSMNPRIEIDKFLVPWNPMVLDV